MLHEGRREAVALVDELLENGPPFPQKHGKPRQRSGENHEEDGGRAAHQAASDDTSAGMGGTSAERYAVVSCHVERALDDAVWTRFAALQKRRPGGFRIAALLRPADPAAGESEDQWVERARQAAATGPLGHHTHWTTPDHARPSSENALAADRYETPAQRVRAEGAWIRKAALNPTLFCGGGWYTDAEVADACAELGYVDCTPRASRPPYLAAGEAWVSLAEPARLRLPSGRSLVAIPTTHSLGDLGRALARRSLPDVTHVYFHDTDLLSYRRSMLLPVLFAALATRAKPTDLDMLAAQLSENGPAELAWADVTRL
jgi:hypothetical protein